MGSEILIVAVVCPPNQSRTGELNAILDDACEHYEPSFKSLREIAKDRNIQIETEIAVGHAAEQIVSPGVFKSSSLETSAAIQQSSVMLLGGQ